MKKEMVERDEYEDEIELVDLVKILVKNKVLIIAITVMKSLLNLQTIC